MGIKTKEYELSKMMIGYQYVKLSTGIKLKHCKPYSTSSHSMLEALIKDILLQFLGGYLILTVLQLFLLNTKELGPVLEKSHDCEIAQLKRLLFFQEEAIRKLIDALSILQLPF